MRSVSYVAIADTVAATRTGSPIPATQVTQCTVIASVAGATSPVGTLKLQASNDAAPGFPTSSFAPTTWVDVKTTAVSGNGSYSISYTNVAYEWLRVVYVATSGSGGLVTATFEGVGPGATSGMSPGGDLAGSQSSQEVIGIQGVPIESGGPANGEVLAYNSSTQQLEWSAGGGGGGVTSVTASSPLASSGGATPDISLSGNVPVANGGTGVAVASANLVFSGPTSGVAAAPSFRSLDYPDLPAGISKNYALSTGSVTVDPANGASQTLVLNATTTLTMAFSTINTAGYSATVTVMVDGNGTNTLNVSGVTDWITSNPFSGGAITPANANFLLVVTNFNLGGVLKVVGSWQQLI